ncbi:hypothetical protein Lal_00002938 [Lupinus albus]|nr:hypothetical protein Lal_00002938 [Lupinus albus]
MKRYNSFTLIFILQTIFLIISIAASQSLPKDTSGLIEQICSTAPYDYEHCIWVLSQIFRSPSSPHDIWGFNALFVNDMEAKAKEALAKINVLQRAGIGPKIGLDSCYKNYNTILLADIPKVREALKKKDTKIYKDPINDAFNKVKKCETDYPKHLSTNNKQND